VDVKMSPLPLTPRPLVHLPEILWAQEVSAAVENTPLTCARTTVHTWNGETDCWHLLYWHLVMVSYQNTQSCVLGPRLAMFEILDTVVCVCASVCLSLSLSLTHTHTHTHTLTDVLGTVWYVSGCLVTPLGGQEELRTAAPPVWGLVLPPSPAL
jgi:hypothetical protein